MTSGEAYDAARLALELGRAARQMRESRGWSQSERARAAGMTRSAVARSEAAGSRTTARAPDAELEVRISPRAPAA
ncbi:helix-turn-helix domain-containing protein [Nonomuraea sp. NPDC050783]|uniref:helix-turn-helix domain-containing protein n=1 Tax=Nonomuraea sp. NPDC050783 TaxID=3154634 RepID=UPI0034657091